MSCCICLPRALPPTIYFYYTSQDGNSSHTLSGDHLGSATGSAAAGATGTVYGYLGWNASVGGPADGMVFGSITYTQTSISRPDPSNQDCTVQYGAVYPSAFADTDLGNATRTTALGDFSLDGTNARLQVGANALGSASPASISINNAFLTVGA